MLQTPASQLKPSHWTLSPLYGITPDAVPVDWIIAASEVAMKNGLKHLQVRSKHLSNPAKLALCTELLPISLTHGCQLIVNDDANMAADLGLAVHLGASDGSILHARSILGPLEIIGASCYGSLEFAEKAVQAGANYIAFGALFPSSTKPAAPLAPLTLLQEANSLKTPIVGIGGVTLANAAQVIHAGATSVAVISELFPNTANQTLPSYCEWVKHKTIALLAALSPNR